MLIIKRKDGETIESALRRFKKKVINTKLIPKLRERQAYRKPGEIRREQHQNAVYRQKLSDESE